LTRRYSVSVAVKARCLSCEEREVLEARATAAALTRRRVSSSHAG
jgi:hypothetical protein